MKTLNILKKVFALGVSLSLIGTTIMGAFALSLEDYPKPFVTNGVPSSNLVVIVGDDANSSDAISMGDIITGLQASSVTKKEIKGQTSNAVISTDDVFVGSSANQLTVNETIGSVKDLFSETDLEILKGGFVTSAKGATKYNQYLKFNSSPNFDSTKVILTEDNFLNLADFFFIKKGDNIFDWELNFENGFTSSTSDYNSASASLDDLNFKKINILGQEYTIVNTVLDTRVSKAGANAPDSNHSIKIELLGGGVNGVLTEGQEETFYFSDKPYKIKVIAISTTKGVVVEINGKQLTPLKIGEYEVLDDGTLFGVRYILVDGDDYVHFTLGGLKLEFMDNDATDDVFTQPGASVNGELIDEAQVKIKGMLNDKRTEFELKSIKYRLRAESTGKAIYVPPGHGVREYLDEPEGMLSPGWDIKYEGLADTGTTIIKLRPSSPDEYILEFTNEEGLNYQVPAFTVGNATVRTGRGNSDYHQMLWTVESPNNEWYQIKEKDFFVLSNLEIAQTPPGTKDPTITSSPSHFGCAVPVRTATKSSGANTRIMQYVESNKSKANFLTFRDLATGYKRVRVNNTVKHPEFRIIAGGNEYVGRLDPGSVPGSTKDGGVSRNVTIDLDGNGTISRGASGKVLFGNAWIVTQGGAILFINTTSNYSTSGSKEIPRIATGVSGVQGGAGSTILGNNSCITTTILATKFDSNQPSNSMQHHFNVSFGVIAKKRKYGLRTGNKIGLSLEQLQSPQQKDWGLRNFTEFNLTTNPTISRQLDIYGGLWEIYNPLNNESPEEFTYEFPLSQRGPVIKIGNQEINVELLEELSPPTIFSEEINKLPMGVSKLASEIKRLDKYNSIIVGGPCANKWAAELMNNPEPCYESIPEGEALLKLYEHANGNVALLVAGRDAIDTRRGARALLTKKIKQAGSVKEARVTGISLSEIVIRSS